VVNDVSQMQILPRVTHVATATKFETKTVITQLVWDSSPPHYQDTYIHTYSFITQNDRTHLHKIKIQVKKYE